MPISFFENLPKWALALIWVGFFLNGYSQNNLVINGDLEDMRKMPLPENMAIDGVPLEFEEDSSFFPPLVGEQSKLGTIAAPGWLYTSYDSVNFSASYSSVGYAHRGTNFKLLKIYRGSLKGRDASVSNAVASLCRPLLPGKQYRISFYLKPFSGTAFTSNIGVALTSDKIPYQFQFLQEVPNKRKNAIKPTKQLTLEAAYKLPYILEDTSQYTLISFIYTAKGGEIYVYLGNLFFETDEFWKKNSWEQTPHFGYDKHESKFFICYYALDDLEVIPLDTNEMICPVVLDTLTKTTLPDTICLASYYYQTDSAAIDSDFNLLIDQINNAPNDYGVVVFGHTDLEGRQEDNYKLSLLRAEQVKLKIAQAIFKPIFVIGLGSTANLYEGIHSGKNRRVDVCLVRIRKQ